MVKVGERRNHLPMEKSNLAKRLGSRLQKMRNERGLTQEQVAESAGLVPNYVSEIERGAKLPTLDTLASVADALGVTLSEVVLGVDRPLPREATRLDHILAGQTVEVRKTLLALLQLALRLRA
ncbi:MAG: helix-turn-helix transcriptional regulator [Pseudomonadota bacterium]